MAIGKKICRICGKEYEACHTLRPNMNSEFRWQDVACSPEHGAEYLRRILESRGQAPKKQEPSEPEPLKANEETAAPKKKARRKKNSEQTAAQGEEMA